MKLKFTPLDYDYFDYEGKNYAKIIGRDEKRNRVCIIDEFKPYLWAIFKEGTEEKKIKQIQEKINKLNA